MNTQSISCQQANKIDLVEYLESLDYKPRKIRHDDYWYCSPLREEKEPSFKVSRKLNVWYDHGMGKGGNLVDFGILYYRCSVKEFLKKLSDTSDHFSFHQHNNPQANRNAAGEKEKITVLDTRPVVLLSLQQYLHKRLIPIDLANRYFREVDFELYGKKHTAIGFQNNSGGYELRSEHFKGSNFPKDVTLIEQNVNAISVFEGFFSFLSFHALNQNEQLPLTNFLVLNSLAFFEKSRPVMEKHEAINLYLDRDNAGIQVTRHALTITPNQYEDCSHLYAGYKDLNEWAVQTSKRKKQALKSGGAFRLI